MAAAHADTAAPAAAATAKPGTDTPALVTGLHEEVPATGTAADAARGHLKAKKSRYRIEDTSSQDLASLGTTTDRGGRQTVRFQQKYRGVDVLGGQYVVRMTKKDGKRTVTGTSGSYFTQLKLPSVTPKVSEKVAVQRAIAAATPQLGSAPLHAPAKGKKAGENPLSGKANGVVVLPQGEGVLARHITVTGTASDGSPVQQEVYVDAHSGFPLLQYSGIQTFGTAHTAAGDTDDAARTETTDDAATDAVPSYVVKGSGTRYNGQKAELNLYKGADGTYQMIDYGLRTAEDPFNGPMLKTYDARGVDAAYASGVWPSGVKVFSSATPEFGVDATNAGAVDAHWAANKVYAYYKNHFGRKGLDDKDEYINSLVGVTANGGPYNNAFWDGTKMVYGQGGGDYRTFSADTDVVGHEMTHGVTQYTANLVYVGQSGAINEAISDYFGNAIDLEANGQSMDDPDSGLLGEDLCTTLSPRECALRDLNNDMTTQKDFIGVTARGDSGGVHLNSPIFSGALWDIRKALGGDLSDQIVYRALTSYMTPLDGFTEGRAAVVAAAQELGAGKAQVRSVEDAFARHGIVPGWETKLGTDTDTLLTGVNTYATNVGAGGGKYAVSRSNEDGSEPYSVWLGDTSGKGAPRQVSPNNGDYNVYASTDGKTVVWADYSSNGVKIMARPVDGGLTKQVDAIGSDVSGLVVEGDYVAYTAVNPQYGVTNVRYVNMKTGEVGLVDGGRPGRISGLPSVKGGKIAFAAVTPDANGNAVLGINVFDAAAGTTTAMPVSDSVQSVGQTAITDDGVFWIEDTDLTDGGKAMVRRAGLDGTNPVTVVPESGSGSLYAYTLTASDDAVTVTQLLPATSWANETLPKLYQVAPDGEGGPKRVSCNRGDQAYAAADTGQRVLWLDGTTGSTDLVKRDKPVGKC
ncbi:M4 family metallopeptidase [Streptomyces xanthii]|uniref:Peptidase M4 family protein n=1 Tax=Streptomyces xanthii TaxID=2768069 RepID=A0A7H1BIU9_9ACTN|nr:M4 family metallopeptidase [Streptomyces xanthii]QNS08654.1 peptidase M4 family protein [Streptomyces xanthii]